MPIQITVPGMLTLELTTTAKDTTRRRKNEKIEVFFYYLEVFAIRVIEKVLNFGIKFQV